VEPQIRRRRKPIHFEENSLAVPIPPRAAG
jgi:hypothetical protein